MFNYKKFSKDFIDYKFDVEHEEKRHIGLRELAKSIKVSPATLSRIMYGRKADIDTILAVSKWMQKDINSYIK